MRERVLVAEEMPRRPPAGKIRMLGLGDEDAPEARERRGIVRGIILQLVERLEVEGERAARAVDLEPQ